MPTRDRRRRLDPSSVRAAVAAACFPPPTHGDDLLGLEVEVLPITTTPSGTRRTSLAEVLALTSELAGHPEARIGPAQHLADGTTRLPLVTGGWLTFEPGAQIEVSGACVAGPAAALDRVEADLTWLADNLAPHDVRLVSVGVDCWHDVADVPQQLTASRYPAMAAYLAQRGPWGATMMRHTASIQLNLDPGTGTVRDERWTLATLVAPLASASFACAPEAPGTPRVASRRAEAWRHLDPTRTGVPPGFQGGVADAVGVVTAAALDADVLLVSGDGGARPGRPGWSFLRWLLDGDPVHGWPTPEDLGTHLTTLFHDVRPRGPLELRSVDALPARWRPVPVTLHAGLLYDDRARSQVLDVLSPFRSRLTELRTRAAVRGLADPQLCALAVEAWSYALEGARRLPPGHVREDDLRRCETFIDRFTTRGLAPTDELRRLLAEDPAAALDWAAEPLSTSDAVVCT